MSLYRRGVQRNAGTPLMQVQGSQGAGGAVPRGFAPQQEQNNASQQAQQIGGLLGLLSKDTPMPDRSGFGLSSGVPLVNDSAGTPAGDVLGGLANANNGMSYEPLPTGMWDSLKNGVSQGWQGLLSMFGGGAGA